MGQVETLHLQTIVDFAWCCETCSIAPQVPEGIDTMPELWKHLSGEGWAREGYLYCCPKHPMNNRVWCETMIWRGDKLVPFDEDGEERYRV